MTTWRRHSTRSAAIMGIAAFAAIAVTAVRGQSPIAPAVERFEVSSVKENRAGEGARGAGFQPGGRFRARNMTIRGIIAMAYGTPQPLPLFRVVGGPGWLDHDRYDIDAVPPADIAASLTPPWPPRGQAMLRALLADRFRLAARQDTRDLPAYELVFATGDRRLGPQLRPSDGADCVDPKTAATAPATPGRAAPITCGGFQMTPPERLSARHLTLDELARFLSLNVVERPVINRTGLPGHFSMDFDYTRAVSTPLSAATGAPDASTPAGTSIFTSLPEQLGLRLTATTTPLEVVVVETIERPTAD
jgi:uncharacterized protein (TIGR03435 family)